MLSSVYVKQYENTLISNDVKYFFQKLLMRTNND